MESDDNNYLGGERSQINNREIVCRWESDINI